MADLLPGPGFDSGVDIEDEVREPEKYKVLLHNDDYTTMEFVVRILETVFHKTLSQAVEIMLSIHKSGLGVCGVYTAEVAEIKVTLVDRKAREEGFPLKCSLEEA